MHTIYPKKYAHGFCFAVLCCGYTLTDFPISIRLTSLALWQSNDCPSASKVTLMNMDKYFMWIHYERLHNHNKAKHNKTVCIFLGIYCTNHFTRLPPRVPGPFGIPSKVRRYIWWTIMIIMLYLCCYTIIVYPRIKFMIPVPSSILNMICLCHKLTGDEERNNYPFLRVSWMIILFEILAGAEQDKSHNLTQTWSS